MNAIVAVDSNWAIGNKGQLLIRIPADQKRFREITTGGVVVLGRKTMDTFPQKKPLPNRTNIILSTNEEYKVTDAVVVHSIEQLIDELKSYPDDCIYIIGGDSVYKQMLPYCDKVYVTKIDREYEADTYYPNLDEDPDWKIVFESEEQTYFDTTYTFVDYERVKPQA
jgi:dihydrofolate reductase